MENIKDALKHKKLVIIRFNPDGYTKSGIKHDSCFTDQDCEPIPELLNQRYNDLKDRLDYFLKDDHDDTFLSEKLFFDC